jgi:hypothetical protein
MLLSCQIVYKPAVHTLANRVVQRDITGDSKNFISRKMVPSRVGHVGLILIHDTSRLCFFGLMDKWLASRKMGMYTILCLSPWNIDRAKKIEYFGVS